MDDGERAFPRVLAFYLPQYHPIPENDQWWGPGFTEWRNVVRAEPGFPGHYQPHRPGELGFYDLRLAEVREAQADLARQHGVDGFVYYHYWFGGRRLLERPFEEVLRSGSPTLPFCLCWANENWTRAWDGGADEVLMAQHYDTEDDINHLRALAPALADDRYLRVDGRPLLLVYRPTLLPDPRRLSDTWRAEAARLGLGDLYLCRVENLGPERGDPSELGFDGAVEFQPDPLVRPRTLFRELWRRPFNKYLRPSNPRRLNLFYDYGEMMALALRKPRPTYPWYRCVMPGWDNTPRRTEGACAFLGSTPDLYERWVTGVLEETMAAGPEPSLVFVNAWNEWAEGCHLEPDERHGRAYLEAHQRAVGTVRSHPADHRKERP
ncbi:MAG: glycoside hydrolase family 99-like domain-containing protein [Acidimicrobiales bacterium]